MKLCFCAETKPWLQDQWSFVISNFGIRDVWQIGVGAEIHQKPTIIASADELPNHPLVVLAPPEGKYIAGTISLPDYRHPSDAIYLFGGSHMNLSDELGSRTYDAVYIPTVKHEMFAHAAAYITFYVVKHG